MQCHWQGKIAVLYEGHVDITLYQQLAARLSISLITASELDKQATLQFFLTWRDGCLSLLDRESMNKPGLTVEIEHRQGEQRSWPMPKKGAFAQALGRRTQTIADATAGWGQDSLAMFRMGYQVTSIERNPIMAELLSDAYRRLGKQDWVKQLSLLTPQLIQGDAIQVLNGLTEKPDCIYLDPMFPPKRKQSALTKKPLRVLRELVGDDDDKEQLFAAALQHCGKRVVVKSPDYAEPLGGKPNESFQGKLLRYDVYLKDKVSIMSEWINVTAQTALADGEHVIVDVDGTDVAVFKIDGQFYAIEDVCTHDGAELASGKLEGDVIICPRHGARFCVKTGAVKSPPAYEDIACFPVRIENGQVQVKDKRWD